jgi:hypothetical protein
LSGLAAGRRPGSSSKVEIAERLTVVVADDEASIVVLIDRPGRGKARRGRGTTRLEIVRRHCRRGEPNVNDTSTDFSMAENHTHYRDYRDLRGDGRIILYRRADNQGLIG